MTQQFVVEHLLPDLFRLQLVNEPVGAQMYPPSLSRPQLVSAQVAAIAGGVEMVARADR